MRGAPFDIATFKGRHLLISLHWRGDIFWFRSIWGELFLAEGFLNRDLLSFSSPEFKILKKIQSWLNTWQHRGGKSENCVIFNCLNPPQASTNKQKNCLLMPCLMRNHVWWEMGDVLVTNPKGDSFQGKFNFISHPTIYFSSNKFLEKHPCRMSYRTCIPNLKVLRWLEVV